MNKIICICVAITIVIVLLLYVINFWGAGFSSETTDWGAFADYVGIAIGLLSIFLIYITYKEQRMSNQIERFEARLITMSTTVSKMIESNKNEIDEVYEMFSCHYELYIGDLSQIEREKAKVICENYYNEIIEMPKNNEFRKKFDSICHIVLLCCDYVLSSQLSINDKKSHITELSYSIAVSARILFFNWLILNSPQYLKRLYERGFWQHDEAVPKLLEDVIRYICINMIVPHCEESTSDKTIMITCDNSQENFFETYKRLFSKEY